MKKAIVSLALALVAAVAFALPTTQDVEAQVRQGNYSQAEAMMNEVVTARPGSARAHYVYAEILAHNRNFVKAADEAQKARQIDPALSFTDPAKFRAFEQLLAREQSGSKGSTSSLDIGPTGMNADRAAPPRGAPPREAPAREATGVPGWMWGLGAVVLAWVAWRAMARRKAAGAAGMAAGPAAAGYGPMNPNPNSPYGPGNAYGPGQPWLDIHMTPEDAVRAHSEVGGKRLFPVHWGTFNLAFHAWDEPIRRTVKAAAARAADLVTPRVGQMIDAERPFSADPWWESVR